VQDPGGCGGGVIKSEGLRLRGSLRKKKVVRSKKENGAFDPDTRGEKDSAQGGRGTTRQGECIRGKAERKSSQCHKALEGKRVNRESNRKVQYYKKWLCDRVT